MYPTIVYTVTVGGARAKESCKIADGRCEQPANLGLDGRLRRLPICYRCGEAVCRRCSLLCAYRIRRRVVRARLCADCWEEEFGKLPPNYSEN